MKLSLKLLENFIDVNDISYESLANMLTMGAFEVEEIVKVGSNLKEPILIGKILDIQKHPNADKLQVTQVTTDGKNKIQIICGAKNIEVGQLVPVSLPGAVVINRKDGSELLIKEANLRGIESHGMLCSPGELGLDTNEPNGILIFPENAPIGESVISYLSLDVDIVFEVGSRSNRGDALSVFGLAKEVSALTGKKLKEISYNEPKYNSEVKLIEPKIENSKDTIVFYTTTIENVEIKESPNWLKNVLKSVGIRSINNIVDITNYINIVYGQPLHAYDKEKINGNLISRLSKSGERIVTIDGKERILDEEILVISDEDRPQAIAGVMGGLDSEVSSNTNSIVLEAASFSPQRVRKGSRKVGLTSEASKRFERGVDSNFTFNALLKAIELIDELSKPNDKDLKISSILSAGSPVSLNLTINLSVSEIKRVLNINLTCEELGKLLQPLGFICKLTSVKEVSVSVPTYRQSDVTREIDLIEEIARIYGYDNIPALAPDSSSSSGKLTKTIDLIKSYFISSGFTETYLSSLIGDKILSYKEFNFNEESSIKMLNPLSREHYVLRQSLLPGLLEALKINQNHQVSNCKLFEIGKVFFRDKNKTISEKETSIVENIFIAGIVYGVNRNWYLDKHPQSNLNEFLFFQVKGLIEKLITNISGKEIPLKLEIKKESYLHPSFSLKINLFNIDIGTLGLLHPNIEKKLDILGPVVVFNIYLEPILNLITELKEKKKFSKIPSTPFIERDITVDIQKIYTVSEVKDKIEKTISNIVKDISLISIYELNNDYRSLTFRLTIQHLDRTLTGEDVDLEVKNIINELTSCFKAKFRV